EPTPRRATVRVERGSPPALLRAQQCDLPSQGEVGKRRDSAELREGDQRLLESAVAKRMSSSSEDDTDGTCSPSEVFEIAMRVLLKTASAPSPLPSWLSNSPISALWRPATSSATLPGVAEERISALSGAAIGDRPCE